MEEVSPAIARAIVLRQLPRALRAGLDPDAATGSLPAQLAADAEATLPGIGPDVAVWIRDNVGECSGLTRWLEDVGAGPQPATDDPAGGGLAALDRAAAARDDPVLREIADALVLLGVYGRLAPLAGRAAVAAWPYIDRMPEAQEYLHQLGLASAETGSHDGAMRPPWPELDAFGGPGRQSVVTAETAACAWRTAIDAAFADLRRDARLLAIGLSAIAGGCPSRAWHLDTLGQAALGVGRSVVEPLTHAAARNARRSFDEETRAEIEELREKVRTFEASPVPMPKPEPGAVAIPPGHVLVCPNLAPTGVGKGKDIARGYEHAIGRAMPLVPTPDLAEVHRALAPDFPHAVGAIDAILGAFSARPHVHTEPLIIAGPPGVGKSRLVRRLGEALGVGVYRVDGSNDAGGSFGGTERRWYSSEPCRPFMAIARYRQANPIVMVDEVDKAATRSDYGRLWDAMLQALDGATHFPDPSLQVDLDISWVSVICTANEPSVLPPALLDRVRIVRLPEPRAEHLDALLPGVMAGIAREAGLDPRFHAPLEGIERAAVRARWRGGSLRRLRRAVDAILRVRDRSLAERPQ